MSAGGALGWSPGDRIAVSHVRNTGEDLAWFWCPGCEEAHAIPVRGPKAWTWNGSRATPTFQPSILCHRTGKGFVCHSFVTDGRIQFLGDCTHRLAGQTVDLGEPPEWLRT